MGCAHCLPLQDPVWFSYYGPIRQPGAADALNAAIADHLLEIGATRNEIKKVTPSHLKVPVALDNPAFEKTDDNQLKVHFSTTMPGRITLSSENTSKMKEFNSSLQQEAVFPMPEDNEITLKFDFDVNSGVNCRIFSLKYHEIGIPTVENDKIIIDGVISTVSRVFKPTDDGDNGFSDGLCLICCSAPASVVTFPCRHCCMCRECAERFVGISVHCPVCRATVKELIDCSTENDEIPITP